MTKIKKRIIPLNVTVDGCAYAIKASYFKNASLTTLTSGGAHYPCSGVLEIYEYEENSDKHDRGRDMSDDSLDLSQGGDI